MQIPFTDPFDLPSSPKVGEEEKQILQDLAQSEGWKIARGILHWQMSQSTLSLYNAEKDHHVLQGIVKGIAFAISVVESPDRFIQQPKNSSSSPDREAQFHNAWEKSNVSGY